MRLCVIGGLELVFDTAALIPNVEMEPEPDPVSVAEVSSDSLHGLRQHAVTESTVVHRERDALTSLVDMDIR